MSDKTKSPFELRFDVLAMAKEMMDKQYQASMDLFYQNLESLKAGKFTDFTSVTEYTEKYMPKMYSPEEIKAQATKLYEFITTK